MQLDAVSLCVPTAHFLVARNLPERDLRSHYGVCGSVDRHFRLKKNFKFISEACTWWKMIDDPPSPVWLTRISPKILEFRFGLHIVKDDSPPPSSDIWWKSWKFYFCMYPIKDISVKPPFLSSGSKVVEWTPPHFWHLVGGNLGKKIFFFMYDFSEISKHYMRVTQCW